MMNRPMPFYVHHDLPLPYGLAIDQCTLADEFWHDFAVQAKSEFWWLHGYLWNAP
jgi:hypothetical protein